MTVSYLFCFFLLFSATLVSIDSIGLQKCPAVSIEQDCNREVKTIGESCNMHNECGFGTGCFHGKCSCFRGLMFDGNGCIPAPMANQNCLNGMCSEPFVCNATANICLCADGLRFENMDCLPVCQVGEFAFEGNCIKVNLNLSDPCQQSSQCRPAYSECSPRKPTSICSCIRGTTQAGNICVPDLKCPNLKPPVLDTTGTMKSCQQRLCSGTVVGDTCGAGEYCMFLSNTVKNGFCCKVEPYCPFGEAESNFTCISEPNLEVCPQLTHYCQQSSNGVHCCPKPCTSVVNRVGVIVDGMCYDTVDIGQQCEVTEQCQGNSQCHSAICQCMPPFVTQQHWSGRLVCRRLCARHQILVDDACLDTKNALETCEATQQCASHGLVCRAGKCQCDCGQYLYYGRCIKEPQCPGQTKPIVEPITKTYHECSPLATFDQCPTNSFCHVETSTSLLSGGVCCAAIGCPTGSVPALDTTNQPKCCTPSSGSNGVLFGASQCGSNEVCFAPPGITSHLSGSCCLKPTM